MILFFLVIFLLKMSSYSIVFWLLIVVNLLNWNYSLINLTKVAVYWKALIQISLSFYVLACNRNLLLLAFRSKHLYCPIVLEFSQSPDGALNSIFLKSIIWISSWFLERWFFKIHSFKFWKSMIKYLSRSF